MWRGGRGALPEPRVKQKCTHHVEVEWSRGWLVCWAGAPGFGIQKEEKERLGDLQGQGLSWILAVLWEGVDVLLYLFLFKN